MTTDTTGAGGLPDLKACPFCGSPAKFITNSGSYGYYPPSVMCGCSKCPAHSAGSDIDDCGRKEYPSRDEAYKLAADNWNRRAYGELCRAAPAGGDEELARFGHHFDPAIDFEIEVESLQSRLFNAKHGLAKVGTQPETVEAVTAAIDRAMEFRVGGDQSAVRAKAILRALQSDSAPAVSATREGDGEVQYVPLPVRSSFAAADDYTEGERAGFAKGWNACVVQSRTLSRVAVQEGD